MVPDSESWALMDLAVLKAVSVLLEKLLNLVGVRRWATVFRPGEPALAGFIG
ncbi:MAG: hypothetical protein OEZ51_07510 [Nitrospinota bacterium]|nr:hypothetical protein [Nitrospinota bacterium]